ncbi:MAG: AAA family ATPase [Arachnia propionica]|uniref:MinD/ParA family ATP-binding protein n=1 Tax=Arachnia propionica TaxID=1750 RepID=UPI0027008AB8|nr:AAA family ATPase [Arachnia propionica]
MTNHYAYAVHGEDGLLEVTWSDPEQNHPTELTVGDFCGLLRDMQPYSQGRVTAVIKDMDQHGHHTPGAVTLVQVTDGCWDVLLTPADDEEELENDTEADDAAEQTAFPGDAASGWLAALTPPSTPSADDAVPPLSAPNTVSTPLAPSADSTDSADGAPSSVSAPSAVGADGDDDGLDPGMPPRRSFLDEQALEEPARQGWRGLLTSLGWRIAPGAAERAERADVQAVSQHWPGPRTIAVVNGKGGAGKTPTTILLAAILARYGGAGVLAWDNNQTRGTLGWRTEQGPHDATVLDLLPHTERLLGTGAQAADLAHFVHHQTGDRYDVLRSQPLELAAAQRVNAADVDAIHAVAAKYYRLVLMDSGNDESDPMWQRMIDHTDQLVIATTTRNDHAEAGALLLEALTRRDPAGAALAQGAVVIVSQADPGTKPAVVKRITGGFNGLVRDVVTIPYDAALVGGRLHSTTLKPATQRAWLHAAAAVARGL